jgi:peroxiredoxin
LQWIILVAVAAAAAGAGYLLSRALDSGLEDEPGEFAASQAAPSAKDLKGQPRPDFTLRDASGAPVSVSDFDGKILLVNFWASWCKPCVEEMPLLSDLQRDHGADALQVIGIALDDPQRAQAFAEDLELHYPLLFGLADAARVGRRYGNREGVLPYSVLIDTAGIVRWTHLGALTRDDLEARLAELR